MLPKNGHSVEKKYFLYSIIKIYDVNYYLKHRKNIFCNFTIFELVNEIGDFESLCIVPFFGITLDPPGLPHGASISVKLMPLSAYV